MTAPLDGVQPLFITVDPERDTPAHLADYVAFFHPRLIGLTGDAKHIQDAARAYKRYSDGREEADVMWSGLRLVETQFGEAGFAPR
jgi:cytochrome oxidase Cu insertion factor (SCO1/SenC/PrrC family)